MKNTIYVMNPINKVYAFYYIAPFNGFVHAIGKKNNLVPLVCENHNIYKKLLCFIKNMSFKEKANHFMNITKKGFAFYIIPHFSRLHMQLVREIA